MNTPMRRHAGSGLPLRRDDVDTDQIVPAEFCRRITRTGYADALFARWRQDEHFPLNDPAYTGATILIAGHNFGTGSSREHAVWALRDWGFRAVLAAGFGGIFQRNALNNALLPVTLPPDDLNWLAGRVEQDPATEIIIDLELAAVRFGGRIRTFAIDSRARELILAGADEIDRTLERADRISAYETARDPWLPRAGEAARSTATPNIRN
ncbi:MAG: 3-isopropylmalate dehydratase small subunit [Trebonia sp.]